MGGYVELGSLSSSDVLSGGPRSYKNSGIETTPYPDYSSKRPGPTLRKGIYQGLAKIPIPFSMELADILVSYTFSHFDEDFRFLIIPDYITNIVGNELKRYLCAIEAYRQSNKRVHFPIELLVSGLRNKDFQVYLKRVRLKSFLYSSGLQLMEEPDWWNDVPRYHVYDIGEIFNYSYCFRWEESDPEDYLVGWKEPPRPLTAEVRKEFRDCVEAILPDSVERVLEEEILLKNSSSSAFDPSDHSRKTKVYKEKESKNSFSSDPLFGKRCLIYVSPDNYRDTIILSVPQSNSVKLIEQQCALIAERCDYSAYIRDEREFDKALRKYRKDFSYFLDRDLEKEGITKPRELVQIILEVLEEKYPGLPAWKYKDIYKDYRILHDGKILNPPRGHGLGMANALTTIMQCAVVEMVFQRMNRNDFTIGLMGALAYNDDLTIGFTDEEDLETYWDSEDSVMTDLRLLRKNTKSHRGEDFVLCERYNESLNRKLSYHMTELFNIFSAPLIGIAKSYSSNLSSHISAEMIDTYIHSIVDFWGYEFYEDEWRYPAAFGGWISPSYLGIRLDHHLIGVLGYKYEIFRARNACKLVLQSKRTGGRIYRSPLIVKYGPDLNIPSGLDQYIIYMKSIKEVENIYRQNIPGPNLERMILGWQNIRYKAFEKRLDTLPTKKEAFTDLVNSSLLKDFLPDRDICVKEPIHRSSYPLKRAWVPNNLLSFIKYFNRGRISDSIIPFWKGLAGVSINRKLLSAEERRKLDQQHYLVDQLDLSSRFLYIDALPPKGYCIYDSNNYATCCLQIHGSFDYLIPYEVVRKELDVKKSREDDLIEDILQSDNSSLFRLLTDKLKDYKIALQLICNPNLLNELDLLLVMKEQEKEEEERIPNEIEDLYSGLNYFEWRELQFEDRVKHPLFHIFCVIDSWIKSQDSDSGMYSYEQNERIAQDINPGATAYWISIGGKLMTASNRSLRFIYPDWYLDSINYGDSDSEGDEPFYFDL